MTLSNFSRTSFPSSVIVIPETAMLIRFFSFRKSISVLVVLSLRSRMFDSILLPMGWLIEICLRMAYLFSINSMACGIIFFWISIKLFILPLFSKYGLFCVPEVSYLSHIYNYILVGQKVQYLFCKNLIFLNFIFCTVFPIQFNPLYFQRFISHLIMLFFSLF